MPVEVSMNTPLADALQHEVQNKLVENGWAPGDSSDTTMAEYLILMVVNGKLEDEIAVELASDLLNLGPEDNSAREFSRWLFATIDSQNARLNGPPQGELQGPGLHQQGAPTGDEDMDMDLSTPDNAGDIVAPTGPKALRNGAGNFRGGRDKRQMGQMGQINRQMDRANNDSVLHRIRGPGGQSDRINSHNSRGGASGRGGMGGFGNGRQQRYMNGGTQARFNHALQNMAAGTPNNWMGPPGGPQPGQPPMQPGPMDVYAMLEQQSRMMQQMQQQMQQQQQLMQNNQNRRGGMNHRGRPLADRVQGRNSSSNNNNNNNNNNNRPRNGHDDIVLGDLGDLNDVLKNGNGNGSGNGSAAGEGSAAGDGSDIDMALGDARLSGGANSGSMSETVCKFNLHCANKDCKFAHQSPAAPPGAAVNVHDVCGFGAACKNKKCTSRHPSPAARAAHQSEMDCKFFPNCTNPHCPFRHPSMPPCRNGGDCTVRGCKFTHVQTMCKFRPCTNRFCTFKHEEGQRGVFPDKVWTADSKGEGDNNNTHISERKFVDESAPEETILPDADAGAGAGADKPAAPEEPVIT